MEMRDAGRQNKLRRMIKILTNTWLVIFIMKTMNFCEKSFKYKSTGEPGMERKEDMESRIHSAYHV